jgi:hypothetical protein
MLSIRLRCSRAYRLSRRRAPASAGCRRGRGLDDAPAGQSQVCRKRRAARRMRFSPAPATALSHIAPGPPSPAPGRGRRERQSTGRWPNVQALRSFAGQRPQARSLSNRSDTPQSGRDLVFRLSCPGCRATVGSSTGELFDSGNVAASDASGRNRWRQDAQAYALRALQLKMRRPHPRTGCPRASASS